MEDVDVKEFVGLLQVVYPSHKSHCRKRGISAEARGQIPNSVRNEQVHQIADEDGGDCGWADQ